MKKMVLVLFLMIVSISYTAEKIKNVVIVTEENDKIRETSRNNMIKSMEERGFLDNKNIHITDIKLDNKPELGKETVELLKKMKPDVVLLNGTQFTDEAIVKPLLNSEIPFVVYSGAQKYVNEKGIPKANVTGVFSMPDNLMKNGFILLNKIVPAKSQKAVFINRNQMTDEKTVKGYLRELNIELKEFIEIKYAEDYMEAVKKYNNDKEVAWILITTWPTKKRNGENIPFTVLAKWDYENRKKPTVSYWEVASYYGVPVSLGVSIEGLGTKAGELAAKILEGKKIVEIPAENPSVINLIINIKNCQELGITIPSDILATAYRIYTDYEGSYIGKE